jgi:hypothetical protein
MYELVDRASSCTSVPNAEPLHRCAMCVCSCITRWSVDAMKSSALHCPSSSPYLHLHFSTQDPTLDVALINPLMFHVHTCTNALEYHSGSFRFLHGSSKSKYTNISLSCQLAVDTCTVNVVQCIVDRRMQMLEHDRTLSLQVSILTIDCWILLASPHHRHCRFDTPRFLLRQF